jgi:hypothetical protein
VEIVGRQLPRHRVLPPPIMDDAPTELVAISFAASIKIMLLRSAFFHPPVETDNARST